MGFGGHPELWVVEPPPDEGPEENLKAWEEAERYLEYLSDHADSQRNNAIQVALTDAYNRCIEERRRAGEILGLRKRWDERRVGGVVEPESAVRGRPAE